MIVFLDLETSGLDPDKGSVLELAAVACDDDLNEVSRIETLVRPVTDLSEMHPDVVKMHKDSGLLEELCVSRREDGSYDFRDGVPRRFEAERFVLAWIDGLLPPELGNKKPPMGGSSVHFDRAWMKVHMPDFERRFGYRNVDASSFYEGALRWAPDLTQADMDPEPPKTKHRAMPDILFSIERLRVYRRELFLGWKKAQREQAEDSVAHAGTDR